MRGCSLSVLGEAGDATSAEYQLVCLQLTHGLALPVPFSHGKKYRYKYFTTFNSLKFGVGALGAEISVKRINGKLESNTETLIHSN